MFNFTSLSLKIPDGVSQAAGQIAEPGFIGNLLVVLVFIIIIGLYGFLLDRHNMLVNLFSTYLALLVVNFFPKNVWQLGWLAAWWGILVFFLVVDILGILILSKIHMFRVVYTHNFVLRWWQALVSGFLYSGFLMSIVLPILPNIFLNQFSPGFLKWFMSDVASFVWLTAPLVGLLLIRYKRRGPGRPSY